MNSNRSQLDFFIESSIKSWKLLIVDDDSEVIKLTEFILDDFTFEGKPVELLFAQSAKEAKSILKENSDIAVALIDVVMEESDSGLKLVEYIRDELHHYSLRIILRTGQAGYAPEEEVVLNYDINDYKEKAELSETKLQTSIISALRSFIQIKNLEFLKGNIEEMANKRAKEISHELKTPLTIMQAEAEMALKKEQTNEHYKNTLTSVFEETQRLEKIINGLLLMYKPIEQLEAQTLELDFIVLDQFERLAVLAHKKNLEILIENIESVEVFANEVLVSVMVKNLIENAIKYTEKGSIKISLTSNSLTIEDSGMGMDKKTLTHMFDMFYRAEEAKKLKVIGSGLGLSLVKKVCELYNWSIDVKSEVNKGTKITILF